MSGLQTVRLTHAAHGHANGDAQLPQLQGAALSVSGLSPATVSMAGGADLVISGTGFSDASSSRVRVCGSACAVTAASAASLTCTVPSRLRHASGGTSRFDLGATSEAAVNATSQYVAAEGGEGIEGGEGGEGGEGSTLAVARGTVVGLAFGGLTSTLLPRGATISRATLRVVPHPASKQGTVSVDVRVARQCASDADALSEAALRAANSTGAGASLTVPWDMRPWNLGFASDESPDLSALLSAALDGADSVDGCALVLTLWTTEASGTLGQNGARVFRGLGAGDHISMPELRVEFTPPTTEAQLGWEIDASCAVEVSVPTAFEGDGGTCTRVDVAVGNDAADHNPCPHLRLEATAHTDAAGCSLKVNGVDLLSSCGADRTAAYLNGGVCAAVVDSAAAPRAACFDTKTAGKGADQLGLTLALALTLALIPTPTRALALALTLTLPTNH